MSDEQGRERPDPGSERPAPGSESPSYPIGGRVMKRTTRFSGEVVATMISLASAAFGVVAALAWNTAITSAFAEAFGTAGRLSALFVYAVVVTIVGVIVIVFLGRLAARIKAEPLEFKYPGVPRS